MTKKQINFWSVIIDLNEDISERFTGEDRIFMCNARCSECCVRLSCEKVFGENRPSMSEYEMETFIFEHPELLL